jgi:hypothetical protein
VGLPSCPMHPTPFPPWGDQQILNPAIQTIPTGSQDASRSPYEGILSAAPASDHKTLRYGPTPNPPPSPRRCLFCRRCNQQKHESCDSDWPPQAPRCPRTSPRGSAVQCMQLGSCSINHTPSLRCEPSLTWQNAAHGATAPFPLLRVWPTHLVLAGITAFPPPCVS